MYLEQLAQALDFQNNYEQKVKEAADHIRSKLTSKPIFGIVLGSGLGDLTNTITNQIKIPYKDIPNFPVPTVDGHEGVLYIGELEGVSIIGLSGRTHYYEVADKPFNTGMLQVIFSVHVLANLGIENYFSTNAVGGLNLNYSVGDIMIINSHINLIPNALLGKERKFLTINNTKPFRFPPMNGAYDSKLKQILIDNAQNNEHIHLGKYIAVTGPTYETEGECVAYRDGFKADAVGMSVTPEVIIARNREMKVVGISCITNTIDKDGVNAAEHNEVKKILETAEVKDRLSSTITDFFKVYKQTENTI
ncbi:MAG: purine-nucleoside phosphorylase [Candidatus Woesearchaeota archaeon]|jgi:purine-nucleoside phosphorylase